MGRAHIKFAAFALAAQTAFVILFGLVTEYAPTLTGISQTDEITLKYAFYQDVHVMIFVGFGFLMTFLKRYGFSAVGFNFLIGAFVIQWSLFCLGFFHQLLGDTFWHRISLDVGSLISGDFAAASCLIAFGAIIGKTSPLQLLVSCVLQVAVYALNEAILVKKYRVVDIGGSMVIHTFGAYYGLATSLVLAKKETKGHPKNKSKYTHDLFAMIGTLFLWMYWPSFNAATAVGPQQHRTVLNTVISLSASCVTAFLLTTVLRHGKKFEMVDIQNATLAGGVAVGAVADLYIRPYGAALIGCVAGAVSVCGFVFLQPRLERWIHLQDTCGVHNLHGMPGVISGIASIVASAVATTGTYGPSLDVVFPSRDPLGRNWSASRQALMQLAALGTTLGLALVSGLVNGLILRLPVFDEPEPDDAFDDKEFWELPHDVEDAEAAHANGIHSSTNGWGAVNGNEKHVANGWGDINGNGKHAANGWGETNGNGTHTPGDWAGANGNGSVATKAPRKKKSSAAKKTITVHPINSPGDVELEEL